MMGEVEIYCWNRTCLKRYGCDQSATLLKHYLHVLNMDLHNAYFLKVYTVCILVVYKFQFLCDIKKFNPKTLLSCLFCILHLKATQSGLSSTSCRPIANWQLPLR